MRSLIRVFMLITITAGIVLLIGAITCFALTSVCRWFDFWGSTWLFYRVKDAWSMYVSFAVTVMLMEFITVTAYGFRVTEPESPFGSQFGNWVA